MAITLRDVAERANVSPSTVSRILNKKNSKIPISEATRQRVLKAAQEVGYKPNIAARHLAQQQSFSLVGVIVPQTETGVLLHPFFMMVLHGVALYCQQNEYAVTIYFVDIDNESMVDELYPRITSIPADGFIITTTNTNDQLSPRFMQDQIPCAHIGRLPQPVPWMQHFVDANNYEGAKLAIAHLLERGHQKIATITSPLTMAAGVERLQAYHDTMAQAGLPAHEQWIYRGDFEPESGYEAAQQFLSCEDPPTAVFAASDSMATGFIQAVQERGLRVPEDIAVVGFDDNPESANFSPPLTTIRQPVSKLGETAASLLLQLINDPTPPQNIILQPELIIRDSS